MTIIVNELRPITDYGELAWAALVQEIDKINALQRVIDDYDLRRELLGLYLLQKQDASDITAYHIRIRQRERRIAALLAGGGA